ncbi:peptidoglycan bridge formation glycyltransferase FemA/FemB family protein [Lacicoccus alkaliphilus]|uniref:Lipid II:glycine glycyltransferase (Peptidoglycan interpeptide bridge formation enzyme) n=1 Tax=Lacicoccus alkaliphilus DSM 16010 TaxID=1123231 RepID=A0A1M7B0T2_9BACL|nr:peptidoglycan bridge formation glycyltransferase FemA/FemB family protein [Salinicoccus alkaliphilus]SHL48506.1 Lipid II:glycine glycyltransferase (Peptidoglycan interpeptide bridge formation enzyme) [Salinicoccus alkaliphilus DSM 16010]
MHTASVNEQTFKKFISEYDSYMHYLHDDSYYDYISAIYETHLLGLYEGDELIGVTMLSATSVMKKYRLFTSHTGPLIRDFNNERLKFFLEEIDEYVQQKGALQLIHSPYHIYQMRDKDGNGIEHARNNPDIIKIYENLGYSHHGFTKQLVTEELLRYQGVLDITPSEQELMKNMDSTTRYNTKQADIMPVRLRYLEEDEYDTFIEIYKETEERIGFDPVPSHKIKNLLKTLKDKMYLVMTYVNVDEYLNQLADERDALLEEKEDILDKEKQGRATKGQKKKLGQIDQQLDSKYSRIEKVEGYKAEFGTELNLSAAMYYYNNHEMVYLFSGSYPELSFFKGTNYATWEMIKKAKALGLKRFNFFGLTGDFTEDAKDYGVYKFKKGYNIEIEELPGTFDKVFRKLIFKIARKLNKI